MSVTCNRPVVFSGYSCFLHQENWLPWYNWNIVESGINTRTKPNLISSLEKVEIVEVWHLYVWENWLQMFYCVIVSYEIFLCCDKFRDNCYLLFTSEGSVKKNKIFMMILYNMLKGDNIIFLQWEITLIINYM